MASVKSFPRAEMHQAIAEVINGLKAAAVPEARTIGKDGFTPVGGTGKYVSIDSVEAWAKANKLSKGETETFKQVVRTWATRVARKSVDEKLQRVELKQSTLNSLKRTLKQFFETHNKAPLNAYSQQEVNKAGATAKAIASQFDNLTGYDYGASATETPREFALAVDKLMNDLYGLKKGNAQWGRTISLSALFQTIRSDRSISKAEADAMFKTFRYVSRVLSWGSSNSSYICFDQRVQVQRAIMKLFAGNSPTKAAIEKAYGK